VQHGDWRLEVIGIMEHLLVSLVKDDIQGLLEEGDAPLL